MLPPAALGKNKDGGAAERSRAGARRRAGEVNDYKTQHNFSQTHSDDKYGTLESNIYVCLVIFLKFAWTKGVALFFLFRSSQRQSESRRKKENIVFAKSIQGCAKYYNLL